jgi:hypothetical protein
VEKVYDVVGLYLDPPEGCWREGFAGVALDVGLVGVATEPFGCIRARWVCHWLRSANVRAYRAW